MSASYSGQLRDTKMLNCDWSVDATAVLSCLSLAHISDVDQMTAQTGSTEVGPIRLSNRSDNCRALVKSTKDGCRPRAHTARFYVSTPDERLKSQCQPGIMWHQQDYKPRGEGLQDIASNEP